MIDVRSVTGQQLDALQRVGYSPDFRISSAHSTAKSARTLFVIEEVGRDTRSEDLAQSGERQASRLLTSLPGQSGQTQSQIQPRLSGVLVGAYGARHGVAFALRSVNQELKVHVGQFALAGENSERVPQGSVLLRLLRGQFAPLRAIRAEELGLEPFSRSGLVLGIPTAAEAQGDAGMQPVDRLIRAMVGQPWACLVLAQPVEEEFVTQLRGRCLDEIRRVEAATSASGISNPLAQRYLDLLNNLFSDLMLGLSIGTWRVATYLLGTDVSFAELAALWRGLHSQGGVGREPVRVIEHPRVLDWARAWSMPDEPTEYSLHPYAYQSLLTSAQLAQLLDFPSQEATGFSIRRHARFDVTQARRGNGPDVLTIGAVTHAGVDQAEYALRLAALQRHTFIAGVTGAGKTNTVFHLLRQLHARKIPFLILEPAKSEYRALLADSGMASALRVYTVGDERTAPLRLNPFEVVGWPVNPVSVHIDLLRSCFAASFGMWTPLPQILEQCLHEIYRDCGWDVVTNTNFRLPADADPSLAFPTMADLANKVDFYTSTLGYDDRVRNDLRAALLTRVKGLRIGGKGAMFECRQSAPMEQLLTEPCILELQNLGDDDDKSFLMALLFIRIVEFRRAAGTQPGLRHLLVIEEAHRLLTNVGRSRNEEQADPRGKAVETFSNLISEIRAYGQGLAVVDQVPTKLAPDVIKNTNLKIVHRIVAEDDRSVLAGAMAMDEAQKAALASFGVGKVAVFEDGEDAPLLLTVPAAKDQLGAPPTDEVVRARMRAGAGVAHWDRPHPVCNEICRAAHSDCRRAADAAEDALIKRTLAKLTVSALGDPGAVGRVWSDLVSVSQMRKQLSPTETGMWTCMLVHGSTALARRWGRRLGWPYSDSNAFGDTLARALVNANAAANNNEPARLLAQQGQKLLGNGRIECMACTLSRERFGDTDVCLSRPAVLDLIDEGTFAAAFASADRADQEAGEGSRKSLTLSVGNSAAYELIEFPAEGSPERLAQGRRARRCLLCFTYHSFARTHLRAPWVIATQLRKAAASFDGDASMESGGAHDIT